jgi:HNH endonuclease
MKQIKEFPDYSILSNGIVINTITGKVKSVQTNYKNGYKSVILYKNNITKRLYIHRLVALAYLQKPDDKNFVNHKDLNKSNNDVSNLEWVTSSENNIHMWKYGNLKQHLSKIVLNIETGIFYNSIYEASKSCNINYSTLKLHLRINKKCSFIYV